MLYQALGAPVPRFAHVPLILGPDKKRLSKRHGATSVTEYGAGLSAGGDGQFSRAARLVAGNDQELFTREELVARVRARRHQRRQRGVQSRRNSTGSISSTSRVWRLLSSRDGCVPGSEAEGLWDSTRISGTGTAWFLAVIEQLKPRAKRLDEFVAVGRFFFTDAIEYDETAVEKHLMVPRRDASIWCARRRRSLSWRRSMRCRSRQRCAAWPTREVKGRVNDSCRACSGDGKSGPGSCVSSSACMCRVARSRPKVRFQLRLLQLISMRGKEFS